MADLVRFGAIVGAEFKVRGSRFKVQPGTGRFHHKAGLAAFYRHPSCASLAPACHFDIHAAIMAHSGTDKKPTGVF